MMGIRVSVIMLLIFSGVIFSGCSTKYVYVPQKCLVSKPNRMMQENCALMKSDFELAQCIVRNRIRLEGDYEALEKAFDGCK